MQALIDKLGVNLNYLIYAAVVIAILLLAWIVLRMVFGKRVRTPAAGRARQPRLGVVDAYDLDRQRQLVLVRRDNVEHLIMIGGPTDILLESTIVRAGADVRLRLAPSLEEPSSNAPLPVPEPQPTPPVGIASRAPIVPPVPVPRPPVVAPPPLPPRVTLSAAVPPPSTVVSPPAPPAPVILPPTPAPTLTGAKSVEEPPPKPKFEFPRLAPRPPEPKREASSPPAVDAPSPAGTPKAVEPPPPVAAPKPVIAAPKPVVEALKPFEPISLDAPKPAPPAPAPVKPAPGKAVDPLEALEEEMAKLLGRPPGAGASKG